MKPSSAIAMVIAGFILAGVIAAIYKIDNATKENAELIRNSIAGMKEEAASEEYRLEDEIDAKVSAADLKEEVRAQFESREKVDKESIKKEVLDTFNSCSFFDGTLKDGLSCNDICQTPKIWGQNSAPEGQTCVLAEFSNLDPSAFSKNIVRCGFRQDDRVITCVCCK